MLKNKLIPGQTVYKLETKNDKIINVIEGKRAYLKEDDNLLYIITDYGTIEEFESFNKCYDTKLDAIEHALKLNKNQVQQCNDRIRALAKEDVILNRLLQEELDTKSI